jgi:hypothetical protein
MLDALYVKSHLNYVEILWNIYLRIVTLISKVRKQRPEITTLSNLPRLASGKGCFQVLLLLKPILITIMLSSQPPNPSRGVIKKVCNLLSVNRSGEYCWKWSLLFSALHITEVACHITKCTGTVSAQSETDPVQSLLYSLEGCDLE